MVEGWETHLRRIERLKGNSDYRLTTRDCTTPKKAPDRVRFSWTRVPSTSCNSCRSRQFQMHHLNECAKLATHQFTSVAYKDRTSLECTSLSFKEIAEGHFPNIYSDISKVPIQVDTIPENAEGQQSRRPIEMVICSFALHLVENPSELFSLLWELSTYVRWLVVLAPHKKPEVSEPYSDVQSIHHVSSSLDQGGMGLVEVGRRYVASMPGTRECWGTAS